LIFSSDITFEHFYRNHKPLCQMCQELFWGKTKKNLGTRIFGYSNIYYFGNFCFKNLVVFLGGVLRGYGCHEFRLFEFDAEYLVAKGDMLRWQYLVGDALGEALQNDVVVTKEYLPDKGFAGFGPKDHKVSVLD